MMFPNPSHVFAKSCSQDPVVASTGNNNGTLTALPKRSQKAEDRAIVASAEDEERFFVAGIQVGVEAIRRINVQMASMSRSESWFPVGKTTVPFETWSVFLSINPACGYKSQ
jgi:hypothetical protein